MTSEFREHPPRRIVAATVAAAVTALVILVTAILPAEYGIDPLGTGRALGLTALSGTTAEPAASPTATPVPGTGAAAPDAAGPLHQDVYEVTLRPFEGVEYKYRMESGAGLVYSWTAAASVEYEFHGEPDGAPAKYFDSYNKGDATGHHGVFTAAKPGAHGWFWKNNGAAPVRVTLRTSGFYAQSTEYRDGERVERRFPTAPLR